MATPELIPLTRAAHAAQMSYFQMRELGLRGVVALRWVGCRVFIEGDSLRKFQAAQKRKVAAR